MERQAKQGRFAKLMHRELSDELGVFENWRMALGKRLAAHAKPLHFSDGLLVVQVEDEAWAEQLRALAPQILQKLARHGEKRVERLEFPPISKQAFRKARIPEVPAPPYRSVIDVRQIRRAVEDVTGEDAAEEASLPAAVGDGRRRG